MRLPGDCLKDFLQEELYKSRLQQRLFGHVPTLEQFLELTEGEVTIQANSGLVAPLTYSTYPFEIFLNYVAAPNGLLIPKFSRVIHYQESIQKLTSSEYTNLDANALNESLIANAEHTAKRIRAIYNREAIVLIEAKRH